MPAELQASRRVRWVIGSLTVLMLMLMLVVLGIAARRGVDHSLDQARERGELRIGYALEAPYALIRADGQPGGESPEVARAVAQRMGLRTVWVLTEFDRLIPELEAGRFDVIAAGMFVTPERQKRVRFSRPTLRVRPGWLTRAGAIVPLGTYAQAAGRTGLRVAAVAGSVEAGFFKSVRGVALELIEVPDAGAGREAVASGSADALALSLPTVSLMARRSEGRLAAMPADDPGASSPEVALGMRRQDEALARAVDGALGNFLRTPEHLARLRELGLSELDLPPAPNDVR